MGKTSSFNSCNISSELIKKIGNLFKKNKPDCLVVFGDRFEMLPISLVSFLYKVPILHIGGGETTEGSSDESIRHAITKLSSFHFVTHEVHKERLIQLGENKENIFVSLESRNRKYKKNKNTN